MKGKESKYMYDVNEIGNIKFYIFFLYFFSWHVGIVNNYLLQIQFTGKFEK